MINILLVEENEVDVMNAKQALSKVNIIDLLQLLEMMATLNKY
ncbi:MAG: hypothetical protein V7K48_00070 [Nostoc sp.]